MTRPLFFCFVINLFMLVVLAAGDEDDYHCLKVRSFNAGPRRNLTSPLYGKRPEYPNNLKCKYRIMAPIGHKIKLTFKDFDVDLSKRCTQDRLEIYGEKFRGRLATLCGHELPRPILSVDNVVTLTFTTDFIQGGRGFVIEYEAGPDMQLCEDGLKVCRNRNCYGPKKTCDGVDDCKDGTDEEGCPHALVPTPSDCGTPEISPKTNQSPDRMVGGEEAVPNSWPWQVSLQNNYTEPNGHFCGGALLNALWVLTASHCVAANPHPGQIKIVLGAHGRFTKTKYQHVRYSAQVIAFPELLEDDVKKYNTVHDMSLIRLNAPVELNAGVHPACLPPAGYKLEPGTQCYGTGWGDTRGTGSSDALKQTLLFIKSRNECKIRNSHSQVCVGNTDQFVCNGDSGGPLQCQREGKWILMGVTSKGLAAGVCGGPKAKTIYAATAYKLKWIQRIIQKYPHRETF